MTLLGFEKETWLDLTVNMIPLGIILFFIVAFAVVPAFEGNPVFTLMQFTIMGTMFFGLALLTYYAGKAVQGAEEGEEATE
jgi:Flp pilus assembly protein protease CpaA